MEVFAFQICVLLLISLSSLFGRRIRNWMILFIGIFTLFAVFMTWLIILQFITIFIGYNISESLLRRAEERRELKRTQPRTENSSRIYFIVFLIISGIGYSAYINLNKNLNVKHHDEQDESEVNEQNSIVESYVPVEVSSEYATTIEESSEYSDTSFTPIVGHDLYVEEEDVHDTGEYRNYSGNFKSSTDNADIDQGSLSIVKLDNNRFQFKLVIQNTSNFGEISGVAIFHQKTKAVFSNEDCDALYFNFISKESVHVIESKCENYHGNGIAFTGLYEL